MLVFWRASLFTPTTRHNLHLRESENNRRAKYYRITERGRKELKTEAADWQRRVAAVARLLAAT